MSKTNPLTNIPLRTIIAYLRSQGYEVTKTEAADKVRIDYAALMDTFNTTFQGTAIPAIRTMTEPRRRAVRQRAAQYGKQSIMQVFRNVLESPFLLGDNDRGWTADFDWIFKPANYTKILERRYNGQPSDTSHARQQSRQGLTSLAAQILAADDATLNP